MTLSVGAGIPFKLCVRFLRQTVKFLGDKVVESVAQHIKRCMPPSIFSLIKANVSSQAVNKSHMRPKTYNVEKLEIDFSTFINAKSLNDRRQLYPVDVHTGERINDLKVRHFMQERFQSCFSFFYFSTCPRMGGDYGYSILTMNAPGTTTYLSSVPGDDSRRASDPCSSSRTRHSQTCSHLDGANCEEIERRWLGRATEPQEASSGGHCGDF